MNFFEHQDRARRTTGRLVVLMAVAVAGIVGATYLLVASIFVVGSRSHDAQGLIPAAAWWQPDIFAAVAASVGAVVGGGSGYKAMQLSGGGSRLATLLGGRLLPPDTLDPLERKILNVVEEMAIASGLTVPPVYLLDHEDGINAFAAGIRLDDAVIGVTRGAVEQLNRDELQGVMAHEFGHILHGDMRLNVRLIAIVHGILVIGLLGHMLLRLAGHSMGRSRDSKDNGLPAMLALFGTALMVIGFVGTFLGSLIKAAVSRQREFLADASAVQFTRNPAGLAGALAKIATAGSRLGTPHAAEASHLFFASALESLFATHPPLQERIRRLDAAAASDISAAAAPGLTTGGEQAAASLVAGERPVPAQEVVAAIGAPQAADIAVSRVDVRAIAAPLQAAAHDPFGCRAVIYGLVLDRDSEVQTRQREHLAGYAELGVLKEFERLLPMIEMVPRRHRLTLVDTAVGTLKGLSPPQYRQFRDTLMILITADRRLGLFEWMVQKIVVHHLDRVFGEKSSRRHRSRRPRPRDVAVLLSSLAHAGSRHAEAAKAAFARGAARTGLAGLKLLPRDEARLAAIDASLDALARTKPASRQRLMDAVAATLSHDDTIIPQEAELLRGVAAVLDCPLPPTLGAGGTHGFRPA
jgi:Zn-dependent protease with chaperone function